MCKRGCFHSGCLRSSSVHHDSGFPPSPDIPVIGNRIKLRNIANRSKIAKLFSHCDVRELNQSLPLLCRNHIYPAWLYSQLSLGHLLPTKTSQFTTKTSHYLHDKENTMCKKLQSTQRTHTSEKAE